jgi:hypothetical protein
MGQREQAQAIARELERRYRFNLNLEMTGLYAALGERDRAFALLEEGYRQRSGGLILMRVEPTWEPLRSDPRYTALMRKVGLVR